MQKDITGLCIDQPQETFPAPYEESLIKGRGTQPRSPLELWFCGSWASKKPALSFRQEPHLPLVAARASTVCISQWTRQPKCTLRLVDFRGLWHLQETTANLLVSVGEADASQKSNTKRDNRRDRNVDLLQTSCYRIFGEKSKWVGCIQKRNEANSFLPGKKKSVK